jgi:hypothetical protein
MGGFKYIMEFQFPLLIVSKLTLLLKVVDPSLS